MSRDEFLWVEKYRPQTIEECILPDNIKKTFQDFLDNGEVPNLLLEFGYGQVQIVGQVFEAPIRHQLFTKRETHEWAL